MRIIRHSDILGFWLAKMQLVRSFCGKENLFVTSRALVCIVFLSLTASLSSTQANPSAAGPSTSFAPLDQWESAVRSGDASALISLYSTDPPPRITVPSGKTNITISPDADVSFWTGLKVRRLKVEVTQLESPQAGLEQVVLQLEVRSAAAPKERTLYISEGQLWQQQGTQWRMVAAQRTDPVRLRPPASTSKDIYPAGRDGRAEIKQALAKAATAHKRVLVVFGANWCYDCHVLDLAFHRPDLAPVLARNYEVVHVDVGEGDKNQDLMNEYQVPMKKGIPALAVLDSNGKLLYSQKDGEFERARALAPEDLLQFLNKWKPQAR
jgi:thioredoxin 1